ncbi:MAG: toll/interleukin-1 receptor domain-containing protein [Acidimicrobiales bacterium]
MGQGIFISYRRETSAAPASQIKEALASRLGRDQVFFDVESIPPGALWQQAIEQYLDQAGVVLVVVSPGWAESLADRQTSQAEDIHLHEIARALGSGLPVIPVLIDDTQMPAPEELPPLIAELPRYNGFRLRNDETWSARIRQLADDILSSTAADGVPASGPVGAPPLPPPPTGPAPVTPGAGADRPIATPAASAVPAGVRLPDPLVVPLGGRAVVVSVDGQPAVLDPLAPIVRLQVVGRSVGTVCGTGMAIDHLTVSGDGSKVLVVGDGRARVLELDGVGAMDTWGDAAPWIPGAVPIAAWHRGDVLDLLVDVEGRVRPARLLASWPPLCELVGTADVDWSAVTLGASGPVGATTDGEVIGGLPRPVGPVVAVDVGRGGGAEVSAALCTSPSGRSLVLARSDGAARSEAVVPVPAQADRPLVVRAAGGVEPVAFVGVVVEGSALLWAVGDVLA